MPRSATAKVAKRRITTSKIASLQPGEELRDDALPGFGIRAHASGATWFLSYSLPTGQRRSGTAKVATRRRLKLGTYPATTLAEARGRALEAKRQIDRGEDPGAKPEVVTLQEAFGHYAKTYLARMKTGEAIEADLKRDLIASLGSRPLASITRADVAKVLDRVEARGPVMANRVLQYAKAMFGRFVERGLIEKSPVATLRKRVKETARDRVLSEEELKALWQACDIEGSWFGSFVEVLILTGMRRGEPLAAKVEGSPVPRVLVLDDPKQGVAHRVTLPRQAVPSATRLYRFCGHAREAKRLGWGTRWIKLLKLAGLHGSGITIHDLRRTWATTAARIGVDPLIIELCLGHAPSGVLGRIGAVYNRHSYTDRCAEAWQRVADHIASVVGDDDEVLPKVAECRARHG
ncbi:tyrosine-type recombinase/integrase [Benzoatithermus flavus]|uniref:Integrase family protein n=1 Tax=Benzoatithermus flavus TaxID=3108223 RepID=A0ABU8XW73_9PROT